jgi:hypothetical protein
VLDIRVSPEGADIKSIRDRASLMLGGMPDMWKRVIAGKYGVA